ncbi:S41 family peptidase [Salisediminibacterium halotolerans]|uniref:S41 family peptidase n=1 Tax=Salisediminibacterium halotolerans TaxID=517425 RepID=UPI000EB1BBF0|nr:S41 family peptidase [Salisediminibacterium halotolerans]RLJ75473.1 carboxyl-terminal processing protease [Actinophytocola xinjiangensis]RPE89326.1 carboxyl-terminal processing protease [Salisediminibacterium halotolerans]TWG36086.1 carboxyl-terminal processing protease [Salisediminibacterium halotolerans]GEL07849.1 peptidase S41 [Salisediminibacterium halotolerans]
MNKKNAVLPVAVVFSLAAGAGGMYAAMDLTDTEDSQEESVNEEALLNEEVSEEEDGADLASELEKIEETFNIVSSQYIDDVDETELVDGAISGMLETLDDPYSVYMDEETAGEFMESLDSSFEGIGAEVNMTDGQVTIVAPIPDTPAEEAGLRPNDQLIEIDGENIEDLSLNEAVMEIRGEKGTTVTLTIDRPGSSDLMEIDVERDEIPVETVSSEVVEKDGQTIGELEIRSFSENTAEQFEEELMALEDEGIDGLILDVRGNPGGYLQSVEQIGDLIVPGGEPIVQMEDPNGEVVREISNLEEDKDYPIVTLINEGSASASEILAAALKEAADQDVVGETTFGKGTVQQTLPFEDGSELKLSMFRWLTSAGNDIDENGVEPTHEVSQPDYFYLSPLENDEPLEYDMSNDDVETAQVMLGAMGYDPGREDGYFDESTEEAVRSLQEEEGLETSGQIDEDTADRMQELLIDLIQDPDEDLQREKAIELLTDGE